jgi:hypothetical protein
MSDTLTRPKSQNAMTTCGHCNVNHHHSCPGGVRNGNGSIYLCGCSCDRAGKPRCTDCNNRQPEEVGTDWRCLDRDACQADIQRRLAESSIGKFLTQWRADRAESREAQREPLAAEEGQTHRMSSPRPSRGPSGAGKPCLCGCEGMTKGGKFLPGHDSKYLNILVALEPGEARELAGRVSEAFAAKLEKRIK